MLTTAGQVIGYFCHCALVRVLVLFSYYAQTILSEVDVVLI